MILRGFCYRLMDGLTDRQKDICNSRVAFTTENTPNLTPHTPLSGHLIKSNANLQIILGLLYHPYLPSSLSTIEPIDHQAYRPLVFFCDFQLVADTYK